MERNDILSKLKDILLMLNSCDKSLIESANESSVLTTDLGLNSVGILYVVIAIEETFQIRFVDVNFSDFRTIGDVVDYIEKKI